MTSIPPERSLRRAPAPFQTPQAVPPGNGLATPFLLATSTGSLGTQSIINRQPESLEINECFRGICRVYGVMRMSTAMRGGGCLQHAGAVDLEPEFCRMQMLLCNPASLEAWGHPGKVTQGTEPGGVRGHRVHFGMGCTLHRMLCTFRGM